MADKQGIRLKMQEMAILETLIFKCFWGSMPPDPLETSTFGARTGGYGFEMFALVCNHTKICKIHIREYENSKLGDMDLK